jgi:hypothetical protein
MACLAGSNEYVSGARLCHGTTLTGPQYFTARNEDYDLSNISSPQRVGHYETSPIARRDRGRAHVKLPTLRGSASKFDLTQKQRRAQAAKTMQLAPCMSISGGVTDDASTEVNEFLATKKLKANQSSTSLCSTNASSQFAAGGSAMSWRAQNRQKQAAEASAQQQKQVLRDKSTRRLYTTGLLPSPIRF